LTFNLSITALAVYFTFNSFDILKNIPSMDLMHIRSLLTHAKEDDDDDDGLNFTSFEDIDDHELMHDSMKIMADYHERLMNVPNNYDLSSQRRDIFDFDLQDSPDPYIIVEDNDDDGGDDNEDNDADRKQTTQQDYLDSDYSLSSRFNTPYNVQ
jgi:hypothetical protein